MESRLDVIQDQVTHLSYENALLLKLMSPLYKGMQPIFGDAEPVSELVESGAKPRNAEVWEQWKRRLGGTTAKVIDALMVHGELDTSQLAIVTGLDKRTITNTCIYKLNQAKVINKQGGRFSLKEL